jgi:uncharacterized membrane protein YqhA
MHRPLTATRYFVLVGVFGLLLGSLAGFFLSTVETVELVWHVVVNVTDPHLEVQEVNFIKLVDGYLVSTGLLIFGLGLYEIFIHELDLPPALRFATIEELKSSLANIIILTLAITYLFSLQEGDPAMDILLKGVATAAIILVLVFFTRKHNSSHHETH